MLVAYGPNGRTVIAEETPLEQLQLWSREHALRCPNCKGVVHVRGGPERRTQLHFAHQRGECAWSTESESIRHMRGKLVLSQWLREQFPRSTTTLEERLPEPNRIADIFVAHSDGQRWAIEFQCAPLEIEQWRKRHQAYHQAGITDLWIIGDNRREKQEAFIEAVFATAHEVMFLDPQSTPPRIWLRWPLPREEMQMWLLNHHHDIAFDGWVGRYGYGATLTSSLYQVSLNEQAEFIHPVRLSLETHTRLAHMMQEEEVIDASLLATYLRQHLDDAGIHTFVMPLLRAYLRDPDLLRRYNYGRGWCDQKVDIADIQRIQKAYVWLNSLQRQGFSSPQLLEMLKVIPFVGPYAAFVQYGEVLIGLKESLAESH